MLTPNQQIVIIFAKNLGFVELPAIFIEYKDNYPIFKSGDTLYSGEDIFWLRKEHATPENILKYQKLSIKMQVEALVSSKELNIPVPNKFLDKDIQLMADEKFERINNLIKKLGFDPRDDSWIESIAETTRQRNWFKFEREINTIPPEGWENAAVMFNKRYGDTITDNDAKELSKKRMRFIMGAYNVRMSGNSNRTDWMTLARSFELKHRKREERMEEWTKKHAHHFPLVRTKQPVEIYSGPYYHKMIESIPQLFVDKKFDKIRQDVVLQVVAYDPQDRYIRLDFTEDVRYTILGNEKPEVKYEFILHPSELDEALEILEPLE